MINVKMEWSDEGARVLVTSSGDTATGNYAPVCCPRCDAVVAYNAEHLCGYVAQKKDTVVTIEDVENAEPEDRWEAAVNNFTERLKFMEHRMRQLVDAYNDVVDAYNAAASTPPSAKEKQRDKE